VIHVIGHITERGSGNLDENAPPLAFSTALVIGMGFRRLVPSGIDAANSSRWRSVVAR
jgi:hypothetical protein